MPITRAEAAHLLRRTGFGPSDDEIDALVGSERSDAVDAVLDVSGAPPLNPPSFGGQDWEDKVDAVGWWINRMISSPTPIQEHLAYFWHSHFACAHIKVQDFQAMWDQHLLIRTHAMGSFHQLCRQISTSSAMLVYLDNATNVAGAVQENYARELMELHTLGIGAYTESDVVEMAKAWTGHNTVGWNGSFDDTTYVWNPDDHTPGNKSLFLEAGLSPQPWNGPETIDEIITGVKAEDCARFITRKLWEYFVYPDPDAAIINSIAAGFVGNITVTNIVRAILNHDEFWNPETYWRLVRTPIEWIVRVFRSVGLDTADNDFYWVGSQFGQTLFDPPNPSGWGANGEWISTATAWARGNTMSNLRWSHEDLGLFEGYDGYNAETMPTATIVQGIFDFFGVIEPLPQSRQRLTEWADQTKAAGMNWALKPNAVLMGGLLPELTVK